MKTLILFLLFSLSSFASITIVSDLDDTIKITNSGEEMDGAINAFLTDNVFTGMPEFLKTAKAYAPDLHVLSASPQILRGRIQSSFKKRKLEVKSIILKNSLGGESKLVYKVRELKRLFAETSDDFILIGDDVGQDPEAYAELAKLYPNRVLAIYIHVIKNRPIPGGTQYWTSFDLFLREFIASRMTESAVVEASELLLEEPKFSLIIPDFAHCPTAATVWDWQVATIHSRIAATLTAKLVKECQAASSGI